MELIQVADSVAREKGIDREEVIEAMEEAIQKAARSKYGMEYDIRAHIARKGGDIEISRHREVVASKEDIEDESRQITLDKAKKIKADAEVGEFLVDPLPPVDFGRIAAQTAKQVILQKVRDAERIRQFNEFKHKVGEIINGTVKRVEYGNVTIDIQGRAEALMRRDETIPRERFDVGKPVRAYIYDVREEPRGPQIFASRTHPQFMAKLFAQEVPEIYDGIIEIKAAARDPGSRAKIAVLAVDGSIDPVGACVGMRGSRVQSVVNELQGEKIDIVPWTEDLGTFIARALAPAEVSRVMVDEVNNKLEVAVGEDQLSLAIGRRGQNVRLASMLTGWDVDVMTEAEESERRTQEFNKRSSLFMEALDVDDVIAHLLVAEGFTSVEEIAETSIEELTQIEGFDPDVAEELRNRAAGFIEAKQAEFEEKRKKLKLSDDLLAVEGLSRETLIRLGENDVKTLDDLADLAGDELMEFAGEESGLTLNQANAIIMKAREHWFAEEDAAAEAEGAEDEKKTA